MGVGEGKETSEVSFGPSSSLVIRLLPSDVSPSELDLLCTYLGVTSNVESSPGGVDLEPRERTDLDLHLDGASAKGGRGRRAGDEGWVGSGAVDGRVGVGRRDEDERERVVVSYSSKGET